MDLSNFLPCPLCSSIPISPIQLIWYTHNPWGHNVSCTISRSKCQRSRSHGRFEVFARWLPPYLTKSCHMCHTHNIWGRNVSHPIFRMKGQRSRPHGSFQMLLHRHVSQRQPIKGQCVVHHFQIKDQCHTDRYKFCHVCSVMEQIELPSVCLCLFHWFTFLCTNFHG